MTLFSLPTAAVAAGMLALLAWTANGQCNPGLPVPRDCVTVYQRGCREDGVYTIDPGCPAPINKPFSVYCDMRNGRWMVFQSRMDGSEDFFRGWTDYVNGFGSVKAEHWLGLNKIHCLTTRRPRAELRVDLADFEGNYKYARYDYFSVGNPSTNYRLNIKGYSGTAGDALAYSANSAFSTKDRDNDVYHRHCAVDYHNAGWFSDCFEAGLNGQYLSSVNTASHKGVTWLRFNDRWESLKFAEMKLRFRD